MGIPHYEIDTNYIFTIKYPAEKLEEHDQNQGKTYIFSVKAFNRAGLSTTTSTDPYTMHSQTPPTKGKVYHVAPDNFGQSFINEIGFQEDTSTLCVKWTDFTHHEDEMQMMVGVGKVPGSDDEITSVEVANIGEHCFEQLTLSPLQAYYFTVTAFNTKGMVNVTSRGIMVAQEDTALEFAKVNDGLGCPNEFHVLDRNLELGNGQPRNKDYIPVVELSSKMRYSIAVEYEWPGHFPELAVETLGDEIPHYSWNFDGKVVVDYFLVYLAEANQTISISLRSQTASLMVKSISINSCIRDQAVQSSTKGLKSSWTFRPEVQSAITHYEMTVHEYTCTQSDCQDGGQIAPLTSISQPFLHLHSQWLVCAGRRVVGGQSALVGG